MEELLNFCPMQVKASHSEKEEYLNIHAYIQHIQQIFMTNAFIDLILLSPNSCLQS